MSPSVGSNARTTMLEPTAPSLSPRNFIQYGTSAANANICNVFRVKQATTVPKQGFKENLKQNTTFMGNASTN